MMASRAVGVALVFFAFVSNVQAVETGFYVGADMAWVGPTVHKSDGIGFFTSSGSTHVFPESVHYDESAPGWSALIGYRFNRNLAAELAYADYGSIDVQEVFEPPGPAPGAGSQRVVQDFKSKVSGPMASVVVILPVSARFEAFGRAGVLWARQELQLSQQFSFNDAEAQWVLGVGLQAELSHAWSARLEYQRADAIPDTVLSGDIDYERVLAGATYRLGSRTASATDQEALAESTGRGFYAVAEFSVVEPAVGKSDGFLIFIPSLGILFPAVPSSVSESGSNLGFGAVLGYRMNKYLAAELAYTDYGSIDFAEQYRIPLPFPFPPDEFLEETIELTSEVTGPSVSVLGILPVGDGFEFFIRGGLLFADEDVTRRNGGFTSTSSNAEELWVVGGGVDVQFSDRWSARFAYESVDRLRKTEFSGPIRLERFMFGVSYDF